MFTPLILFLGLTVATAVIAHWSDNLGKKLGKKRVSLFGLRPRTTATILTVASSWGIMLFTLAALLIAVAPLRNALFSYDQERAQAQLDREQADLQIETARGRLDKTQNQLGAASEQLVQAQKDLTKADSSVRKSREAARKAGEAGRKAEAAANKRAEVARKRAEKAVKAAAGAQKRVIAAQGRVALAQRRFNLAKRREEVALRREEAAQRETQSANRETQSAEREAQKSRRLRQKAAFNLRISLAELRSAQGQLVTIRNNLATAKINLENVSTSAANASRSAFAAARQLFETERQVRALEAQRNQFQLLAAQFVGNDAPVKVGQTFAAGIIAANQSPEIVAAQLRAIVEQGQQSFAKSEDESPSFPDGTRLELLSLTEQDASGKPVALEGETLLRRLARDVAASSQPTSIRLVAPRNFLANETRIETVFVAVPIAPAFNAGEVLASTTIDGSQGDALIFNSLLELTSLGRTTAEKRGVNPPQLGNEPLFYAKDTNVEIFKALRMLESSKKRLRVNLIAARALTTVEPLQIRLEIENGPSGAPAS